MRFSYTSDVDVRIGQYLIRYEDVVGLPGGTEIILGHNVINELVLLLDGPNALPELLEGR